jgi:ABC-2 type transport system ATP-binding protein
MGTTIFFSTHNMEEADEVSDRIAIINAGKIAIIGTPTDIKSKTGKPEANLEDAFIFFTGNKIQDTGNFRETRQARKIAQRLG